MRYAEQAHPRVSGENTLIITMPSYALGSSPRERGKLDLTHPDNITWGLIPA